jgi:glycosyltransferase involved in cell wall biosynthesis
MSLKILLISQSDGLGGASRAAYRTFKCLLNKNLETIFIVSKKYNSDKQIKAISKYKKILQAIYSRLDRYLCKLIEPNNHNWKSSAYLGVIKANYLNGLNSEILNLHWIGHGLMSLRQITQITKPVIWTLHDEWLINPISHYSFEDPNRLSRFSIRLKILNRIRREREKKKKLIIGMKNIYFVSVSNDLSEKFIAKFPNIKEKIFTILNPVDLNFFYPEAENYNANHHIKAAPIVLYLGGFKDPRKGGDLLEQALLQCKSNFTLVTTGDPYSNLKFHNNIEVKSLGKITDIKELRNLYSSSTLVVVPSRAEALGQVATEAISCGTPVLSFNIGGLSDVVINNKTGVTVTPFNTKIFSEYIDKFVENKIKFSTKSLVDYAQKNFSFEVIGHKYYAIFDKISK